MNNAGESHSRRLMRNVLILNSRSLVTTTMGIIGTSLCLHALGVEAFGIYAALWGLVSLLGFLDTTLRSASERYYAVALASGDPTLAADTFRSIHHTLLWLTLITGGAAEGIGIPVVLHLLQLPSEKMPAIMWTYQLTVLTLLAGIIAIPYHSMLVASERMGIIARVQIIMAAYTLGGIACLHLTDHPLVAYAALIASAALITNTIWYIAAMRCRKFHSRLSRSTNGTKQTGGTIPFLRFALWNGVGEASQTICHQGLNLLLNFFFGPVANAARTIAFQIQTFAAKLFDNFRIPLTPQLIGAYTQEVNENFPASRAAGLLRVGSLTGTALMIAFGMPVCFACKGILHLWLGTLIPTDAVVFSCLLIAGMIVDATTYFAEILIKATGNVKRYYRTSSLLRLMSLPAAAVLLSAGAPAWTAPAAYVASQTAITVYRIIYLNAAGLPTRYVIDILLPSAFGVVVSGGLCAVTTVLIPPADTSSTLISTALAVILSAAAVYLIMVPRQAKQLISDYLRRS